MVFPLLHNGPVNYFARLVSMKEIVLEQHDHYLKQTYRNRCRIMGTNGILTLSIPVKRVKGIKNRYRDIRIDYDNHWNRIHWRSLEAAYASSPYFEILADELVPFYQKRHPFLFDLNLELLHRILQILQVNLPIICTDAFREIPDGMDPGQLFHPKHHARDTDPGFSPVPYHQVFTGKHGFRANLSILDLLFNEGPGAMAILRRSLTSPGVSPKGPKISVRQ